MGLRPSLIAATLSALTSMPTTSCPSAANAAAETLPTYPRPKTDTLIRDPSCSRYGVFFVRGRRPERARLRECLNAFAVDERAVPELQVHERPDGVTAGPPPGTVLVEQRFDGRRVDQPALAGAAIEQNLARHVVPGTADP